MLGLMPIAKEPGLDSHWGLCQGRSLSVQSTFVLHPWTAKNSHGMWHSVEAIVHQGTFATAATAVVDAAAVANSLKLCLAALFGLEPNLMH